MLFDLLGLVLMAVVVVVLVQKLAALFGAAAGGGALGLIAAVLLFPITLAIAALGLVFRGLVSALITRKVAGGRGSGARRRRPWLAALAERSARRAPAAPPAAQSGPDAAPGPRPEWYPADEYEPLWQAHLRQIKR